MRCLICEKIHFSHVCKACKKSYFTARPEIRTLENNLQVLSFFSYDEIDFLLKTKHKYIGSHLYKILANHSMLALSEAFKFDMKLDIIPIDDKVKGSYSHTAILANALKSKKLTPLYQSLHSQSDVSYSGQNLAFRKSHPRDFKLLKVPKNQVILVDDIITSGTTLLEASNFLEAQNIQIFMAVTLADANR